MQAAKGFFLSERGEVALTYVKGLKFEKGKEQIKIRRA